MCLYIAYYPFQFLKSDVFLFQDNNERLDDTHEFGLGDCLDYIRTGMEAIVDDEVTKRFSAEELTVSCISCTCLASLLQSHHDHVSCCQESDKEESLV